MARVDTFDGLSEFLAIARHGSFRVAAAELGVTTGAISQALQSLERRLGMPLFHRTTRRVALTEAGETLLRRLRPAADTITETLDDLKALRARPSGTLRLFVHRMAVRNVIEPVLPAFRDAYPEINLEIVVDDAHTELVQGGYDAGIRIGEFIDRDMIAVRVTPPFSWTVLGAPSYLAARGRPATPEDLSAHECIRYRMPGTRNTYRWEFERDGQLLTIDAPGSILVTDAALLRSLAVKGMGLIYTSSLLAETEISSGLLEPVLQKFSPAQDSLFVCFPQSSRNQPKLRAFIEMVRLTGGKPPAEVEASLLSQPARTDSASSEAIDPASAGACRSVAASTRKPHNP